MISTEFYEGQGLGNQLFVYVACRAIAERLELPFAILSPDRFKGGNFLEIDAGTTAKPSQSGEVYYERSYYDRDLDYFSSGFDPEVFSLRPFTRLEGLFQDERYWGGDGSKVGNYIRLKPEYRQQKLVSDDCCVLYIRGGEYKRHKRFILPQSYWENAMRNMQSVHGVKKFVAVSDDDLYVRAMFPRMEILPGTMAEDYAALAQARFAIIANSSWGYFPVRTGMDKTCVIAPYQWARFSNPYERWASAANLYPNWAWQNRAGEFVSYERCLQSRNQTEEFYRKNYFVQTSREAMERKTWYSIVPQQTRTAIRRALGYLFPRHIG